MLDRSGMTKCIYDMEVGRMAFVRRASPFSPRGDHKILFHICEPSGFSGNHMQALGVPEVREKMDSGEFVGCPRCGQVHGKFKEPDLSDIDTLINEFPVYYPGGVDAFLKRWEQDRVRALEQSEKERDEIWGEHIEEAAYWAKSLQDEMRNETILKEEVNQIESNREKIKERMEREALMR